MLLIKLFIILKYIRHLIFLTKKYPLNYLKNFEKRFIEEI